MSANSVQSAYIGRFAPSPTGPLHLGSLLAALASYVDARAHRGAWLVRMEDLDPPREVRGAQDEILRSLEAHGLQWDQEIMRQSARSEHYATALSKLTDRGLIFRCRCTRRELEGAIYPGTCRSRRVSVNEAHALRVRVPDASITFTDLNLGKVSQNLARDVGDFIVRRRDGLHAYQLAVVVDDEAQNVTHVVRGSDLLDNTPRQIFLQRALGLATPSYLHVPVITTPGGRKLSKQTGARALDSTRASDNLRDVLRRLGHPPPNALCGAKPRDLLRWAVTHWQREKLPTNRV
ncbi:MAG: tRNA glutamyl-Q(34) synthetase GluQRS [Gammaproteobacteria bacterium]